MAFFVPIIVFVGVYLLISFEILNKAVAAMLGVAVLILIGSTDLHQAISHVDFETLLLLMGMMMLVVVLKSSGFFDILTVKVAVLTGGNPLKIFILFSVITAVLSAFLDNVTTVLIMVPMVIELTRSMGLDSRFYVITQAIVSNLGGTATLIGDPPNIIITHSPSMEVEGILKKAHMDYGLNFRVLVVEQDFIRIRNLIKALDHTGIDHQVIAEQHLSHHMNEVNKLFLGAVSISSDKKVITTAGSANIASLCRFHRIPIFLFVCTLKFAHQPSERQHIPNRSHRVTTNGMSSPVMSYTHDIVNITLIDRVVTEEKG